MGAAGRGAAVAVCRQVEGHRAESQVRSAPSLTPALHRTLALHASIWAPALYRPGGHSHGGHRDAKGCVVESAFWPQGAFHPELCCGDRAGGQVTLQGTNYSGAGVLKGKQPTRSGKGLKRSRIPGEGNSPCKDTEV